jgi:serine/threonine protein kinase
MHDAEGEPYCAPCAAMADLPDPSRTPGASSTPRQQASSDSRSSKKSSADIPRLNSISLSTTPSLSRHTSRLGTAAYAAPEQIASAGDYSNRVDIFPAGIILFELLSVFSSGHERGTAINNLRKGILPTNFVAAYPIASKWIIRMTDPKPELRPTCAEVLASDLFAVVTPAPMTTRNSDSTLQSPTSASANRGLSYSSSDIDEEQLGQIKDRKLLIRIILEQQKMISELRGQVESRDSAMQQMDAEMKQLQRSFASKSPPPGNFPQADGEYDS